MKFLFFRSFIITAAGLSAITAPAFAQSSAPKLEGTFTDWTVYSRADGGTKICYAISQPKVESPSSVNHGDIYFLVSNWASGAAKEQPSFLAGYPLKTNRGPEASVGSSSFAMYSSGNEAFIESSANERSLVSKMRAGATMTIKAVSERGTDVTYQFSLKGITAALRKAGSACS